MGKSRYSIFRESQYSQYNYAFDKKLDAVWLCGLFSLGSSHMLPFKISQPGILTPMSHCHPVCQHLEQSCAESSHPHLSKNVSSRLQSAHKGFTNSSCLGHFLVLCEYCGFGYISLKHKNRRFWFVTFETSGKSKPELILDT